MRSGCATEVAAVQISEGLQLRKVSRFPSDGAAPRRSAAPGCYQASLARWAFYDMLVIVSLTRFGRAVNSDWPLPVAGNVNDN